MNFIILLSIFMIFSIRNPSVFLRDYVKNKSIQEFLFCIKNHSLSCELMNEHTEFELCIIT